jgi:hypothetical protein
MVLKEMNRDKLYAAIIAFFIILIIGCAAFFILTMVQREKKGDTLAITDTYLEIKGTRSVKISFDEIEKVELKDSIPKIELRIMGSSIKSKNKGTFKLEGIGKCSLYIDTDIKAYIYIETKNGLTIITYINEDETRRVFEQIKNQDNS